MIVFGQRRVCVVPLEPATGLPSPGTSLLLPPLDGWVLALATAPAVFEDREALSITAGLSRNCTHTVVVGRAGCAAEGGAGGPLSVLGALPPAVVQCEDRTTLASLALHTRPGAGGPTTMCAAGTVMGKVRTGLGSRCWACACGCLCGCVLVCACVCVRVCMHVCARMYPFVHALLICVRVCTVLLRAGGEQTPGSPVSPLPCVHCLCPGDSVGHGAGRPSGPHPVRPPRCGVHRDLEPRRHPAGVGWGRPCGAGVARAQPGRRYGPWSGVVLFWPHRPHLGLRLLTGPRAGRGPARCCCVQLPGRHGGQPPPPSHPHALCVLGVCTLVLCVCVLSVCRAVCCAAWMLCARAPLP
jgi:hypothetical protein